MLRRRQKGIIIFSLLLVFSILACSGTTQIPQSPPPATRTSVPPTNPPQATKTSSPMIDTPASPTATTTSTEIPTVTGQINLLEINSFKDEGDYWYFYGLVRNDTNSTVYDVQIEIKLLDAAGTTIYSYTTYSLLTYLAPGETSPFSDFTTEAYTNGATVQATVVGKDVTDPIDRASLEYRGITIWADDYNDVYLAGEIYNNSSEPVELNAIAGALIDPTGKLVTAAAAYTFLGYLEPNSSGPFVMMFDAPLGQASSLTNYNLYTDGLLTNPTSTYDLSLSANQIDYQDVNADFHLLGSITNNSTESIISYLVSGVYDENGNCIDANYIYFPMPINPGDTVPYDFTLWGAMDYVPQAYAAASNYKVIVDWIYTYEASSNAYTLITEDDTNQFKDGSGVFSGSVINNSGQDLTSAIVTISLYSKSGGELIATGYSFVPETLPNNGTGTYEVILYPPTDIDPANIDIVITAMGQ